MQEPLELLKYHLEITSKEFSLNKPYLFVGEQSHTFLDDILYNSEYIWSKKISQNVTLFVFEIGNDYVGLEVKESEFYYEFLGCYFVEPKTIFTIKR